jgi:hypothetical protein
VREHAPRALLAVEMQHVAMKIHIAGKRHGDHAERLHARDQFGRHDGAVFETQTRIAARRFPLQLLIDAEHPIDRAFTVRVHRVASWKPASQALRESS